MAVLKRSRGEEEGHDEEMATCLMLLANSTDQEEPSTSTNSSNSASTRRVFECKTCNRRFPTFQALGGHRASHKRARLSSSHDETLEQAHMHPKSHECPICGTEFAMGQALGGHMRRHRAALIKTSTNCASNVLNHHLSLDLNLPPKESAYRSVGEKIGGFQLSPNKSAKGGQDLDVGVFLGLGMVGKVPLVY